MEDLLLRGGGQWRGMTGQQRDKAGSSLRGLCIEVKVFLMNIFWVGDILLGTVTLFPSQIMVMKWISL